MSDVEIVILHPAKTIGELEDQFIDEEIGFEILSFGIGQQTDGTLVNFVRERENLEKLPSLTIVEVPAGGSLDEPFFKSVLDKNLTILPGSFSGIVDSQQREFVVCRPNPGGQAVPIVIKGNMSFFGGPDDTGVGPNEGLALVEASEVPLYPANMFLDPAQAGAPGLARRLNPKKPYIACRWSELELPISKFRKYLQTVSIEVENAANGQKLTDVRAVDAGPSIPTRIADLSPVFKGLGLDTDQQVIVRIPRPGQTAGGLVSPRGPVDILSDLNTKVPIPASINNGLTSGSEHTMLKKFGKPGELTSACSQPSASLENLLVRNFDVGPFKVNGMKAAANSLKQVFDEIKTQFPQVFREVRTDGLGMLCVRQRRSDPTQFSNHSWGTAIDLKFGPDEIAQGVHLTQRGFLSLFPVFNKFGWFWGAGFSGNAVDSMHFELAEETILNM